MSCGGRRSLRAAPRPGHSSRRCYEVRLLPHVHRSGDVSGHGSDGVVPGWSQKREIGRPHYGDTAPWLRGGVSDGDGKWEICRKNHRRCLDSGGAAAMALATCSGIESKRLHTYSTINPTSQQWLSGPTATIGIVL